VKRARELIYTAERQASRDVSLAGLRPKPGSSHITNNKSKKKTRLLVTNQKVFILLKKIRGKIRPSLKR
jgi:hypothetical protein